MNLNALKREIKFATRERSVWLWLVVVLALSSVAVGFGLAEVERQKANIQSLIESDQQDRLSKVKKFRSWGSAAYYSFHLTYDPPSDLAFAAMGLRDSQPWKHRIRMLALEGQIYERDVGNPSVALIGRFDFAFLSAFIIPLVLIMLLYDLRASEKRAGRYELLEATAGRALPLWLTRAAVRVAALFICLILPFMLAGIISGAAITKLLLVSLGVFIYMLFWAALCALISAWQKPGAVILTTLLALWLSTAVILPAGSRLAIDKAVPIPTGAEILLLQRETVNDAWDLPREATMEPFFARHPEWVDYQPIKSYFEWQWYYAFQQVGDQRAEALSKAYRKGRLEREEVASWVALIAPPSLLERWLQSLAETDMQASAAYEEQVRAYHAALRDFYYPMFFQNARFDKKLLAGLPEFETQPEIK